MFKGGISNFLDLSPLNYFSSSFMCQFLNDVLSRLVRQTIGFKDLLRIYSVFFKIFHFLFFFFLFPFSFFFYFNVFFFFSFLLFFSSSFFFFFLFFLLLIEFSLCFPFINLKWNLFVISSTPILKVVPLNYYLLIVVKSYWHYTI